MLNRRSWPCPGFGDGGDGPWWWWWWWCGECGCGGSWATGCWRYRNLTRISSHVCIVKPQRCPMTLRSWDRAFFAAEFVLKMGDSRKCYHFSVERKLKINVWINCQLNYKHCTAIQHWYLSRKLSFTNREIDTWHEATILTRRSHSIFLERGGVHENLHNTQKRPLLELPPLGLSRAFTIL